jgi:C_GCAxxG_C_C family probable redox protein
MDVPAAKKEALAAFRATGAAHRNCAQAVLLFTLRLLEADPEDATVARYFGGGLARSGLTCGAITGAALSLGFRDRLDPATWADRGAEGQAQLQALTDDFQAEFGAIDCLELSGRDLRTEQGQERFASKGVRETRCVDLVGWTSERVATLLERG